MAATTCTVTSIASDADFNTAISSVPASSLLVIYFHAPWATPCQQMSTILETLASTYESTQPPRISFLSLDAEELPDVSETYDVTQVPLVILQKGGQVVESITGTDASKVRNAVERHAGRSSVATLPPPQKITKRVPTQSDDAAAPHPNGKTGDLSENTPAAGGPQITPANNGAEANGTSKEELNKRLAELVKAAPVMLFMKGTPDTPQCGFSRKTVGILREKGIRYGFFNILADDEVRQGLKEFSDWPTFPQLYVDGELVGGLDIVKEEFDNDDAFLQQYSVRA